MGRLQNILHWIWENSPITKSAISKQFGLNIAIVNTQVNELVRWGIVVYEGYATSTGGRKARLIKLNPDLGHFCVLRISRNSLQASLVDINADIIYKQEEYITTLQKKEELLHKIYSTVEGLREKASRRNLNIQRIGISIAGLVNSDSGISVAFPRIFDWVEVPLKSLLEDKFSIPCDIDNDIQASTNAIRFKEAQTDECALYVQLGPGIGTGLILDGKVYRSPLEYSGELGHLMVKPDGPLCYCGQSGCLESVASDFALVDTVKYYLNRGSRSIILNEISSIEDLTIKAVQKAAQKKDRLCFRVLDTAGSYIGLGLSNLVNLFGPQTIYIDGSLLSTEGEDILLNAVKRNIYMHSLNVLGEDFHIRVVKDEEVPLKGAAYLPIKKYLFESIFSKIYEK